MGNEPVAPETNGVAVKLLATVDLGPEIEGMAGRQLRMRMVTIAPGGVFGAIHDHKDRPGIVNILQGTITDHRDGVATDYGPGVGWPEDRNNLHWLENRGTIPAVEISVDIVRQEKPQARPRFKKYEIVRNKDSKAWASHSVQPTSGIPRVFDRFPRLGRIPF